MRADPRPTPQALASEQVAALGLVQHTRRSDGSELPLIRGPLSFDGEASEISAPPPLLGEHTADRASRVRIHG